MLLVAVLLALLSRSLADFNLLLLHTNDMHARFQQADRYCGLCENDNSTMCYGGFARLKTAVSTLKEQAAAKGWSSIFLNAGDTYQGTPYYTFFKWPIVAQLVNSLGIDIMCLGNHEFDDGIKGLVPFMRNVSVPIVCSNLNTTLEPSFNSPNFAKSIVMSFNNVKIGIIGYLTPDTMSLSNTENVIILDEIPCIQAEAKRMTNDGINIIIALGHSGYDMDQKIAREIEEVDLVVGGHSHTFLYNGTSPDIEKPLGPYPTMVKQASGKMVPVVQAYYATKYLGYMELTFDDNGNLKEYKGKPILMSGDMPQDPYVLQQLHPYEINITSRIHSVIGYTDVIMDGSGFDCKLGECNIGNLITDAFVDYVARHYINPLGWTLAPIGLSQAGSIRGVIDTKHNEYHNGSILLGDVMIVLPWGAEVVAVNMTGQTLLKALEFSVARYEDTITGHVSEFLQVSGLRVIYNVNQTAGHRVVSVDVLCGDCHTPEYHPLNVTQVYGVVLPEYIFRGGDGFVMFKNLTSYTVLGDVDYMVVVQYIQSHSPVHPAVEGRITVNKQVTPSSAPTTTLSGTVIILVLYLVNNNI